VGTGETGGNRTGVSGLSGSVSRGEHETVVMGEPEETVGSFDGFYRQELDWARRLAYVLVVDADIAAEIAHDAFLGLAPRFETVRNPRAYLRVSIVNGCRRHRRRDARRHRSQALAAEPEAVSEPAREILDLVDRLPERQRAVLVLRYVEGLSEAEIADALGCRPGTVKSLASRALTRLREEMDG
jgi:RNA polymerase sigma factor (sigma-70 family)